MRNALWTCAVLFVGILPALSQDRSYDQFAPKPVVPIPPETALPKETIKVGGGSKDQVLPNLVGLVFVGQPADIDSKKAEETPGITLRDLTIPDEDEFKTKFAKFLGKPLTQGGLADLINTVILYHRRHSRPVVDVIVPEQEITSGVIQVLVMESKVGTVTVEGNKWFPSYEIRDAFRNKTNGTIDSTDIEADLSWSNQNPFHTTDVLYQPGHDVGVTDIVLKTQDRFPARFYTGYEDSGNAITGYDRYLIGMNWGDAFDLGLGQQLNYQYTTSGNFRNLVAHSGSYVIPLPWHHTLSILANHVETAGNLPPFNGLSGVSYQISLRYGIPLPSIGEYRHTFTAGFDYKYNHDGLQFGAIPITNQTTQIAQFMMGYDSSLKDPWGLTSFSTQIYVSPGNLINDNDDASFAATHAGASAEYAYSTLELTRLNRLPYDFTLYLRGMVQGSNANLTPSEQIGFGGYDTVRGYDEREVNSDEGYVTNVEIRTPSISAGDIFKIKGLNDQMQFLMFWDYGAAYNHQALPGEASEIPLSSVGGGLRFSINTYISIRADYGFQLLSTGLDNRRGGRADVGMVLSF